MPSKPEEDEPTVKLIARHYEKLGISKGWNRERFNRLCQLMNCTPEEVGALCALSAAQTRKSMFKNHFTPPVSLHLAIIEAVVIEAQCGKQSAPIIPLNLIKKDAP